MLQKSNQAPPKKKAQDAVEFGAELGVVRNDPRVRKFIELYRRLSAILAEMNDEYDKKVTEILVAFFMLQFGEECKWDNTQLYGLQLVISEIAKVYQEVTGKSPRTADIISGKRPFDPFVIELFKREGLDPPTTYVIKQAIKKSKQQ